MLQLLLALVALVVVVATVFPKDELAKDMTHGWEKTIATVMIAMGMSFWFGFRCGVWSERKVVAQQGNEKVIMCDIYPSGKKYHCATCVRTPRTASAKEVTIAQAEAQRKTPCMCQTCEKEWTPKRASA